MTMSRSKNVLFAALLSMTAACAPASRLAAPDGFAHIGGEYDDRVASANGIVVGTRVVPNDPKANLDFWTQAIDLRLRNRGYEPSEQPQDVKNDAGLVGRSLRYVYFDGTRKNRYIVDVYATTRRIMLVEAAGAATDFDANLPKVVATMRSAHLS
jgi:hypothetical protein